MTKPTGYDMTKYWRLVNVSGGLVAGTFWVQAPHGSRDSLDVSAVDVVVWADAERTSGRVFGTRDLNAQVEAGVVTFDPHRVRDDLRDDAIVAEDSIKAAVLAAASAVTFEVETVV